MSRNYLLILAFWTFRIFEREPNSDFMNLGWVYVPLVTSQSAHWQSYLF